MGRLLEHDRRARRRRDALQLGVLAALCLAGYGRALGRYFVSEDFFVLRRLAEGDFWPTAWDQLTGPLLGISFVKFYRPVSAFLIQAEHQLWGADPGRSPRPTPSSPRPADFERRTRSMISSRISCGLAMPCRIALLPTA